MAKVQIVKRSGRLPTVYVYLPHDIVEEAGFKKGDNISVVCKGKGVVVLSKEGLVNA